MFNPLKNRYVKTAYVNKFDYLKCLAESKKDRLFDEELFIIDGISFSLNHHSGNNIAIYARNETNKLYFKLMKFNIDKDCFINNYGRKDRLCLGIEYCKQRKKLQKKYGKKVEELIFKDYVCFADKLDAELNKKEEIIPTKRSKI